MYRKLILLFLLVLPIFADKLEINAKMFEANKNKHIGVFSKNVRVKQGKDFLNCDSLVINLDDNNKIISYKANKVTSFMVTMKDKVFKGRTNQIVYNVSNLSYELIGDVYIKEGEKELSADKVIIDQKTGEYKIISDKESKPVKLIFEIAK